MRIIGGKDYYDCTQAHGQDASITYVRNRNEVLVDVEELPHVPYCRYISWSKSYELYPLQVYFCGVLHLGMTVPITTKVGSQKYICWTADEVNTVIKQHGHKLSRYNWDDVTSYFRESGRDCHRSILVDKRTTVAVLDSYRWDAHDEWKWSIEPYNLREYQFYRVRDPYTAFQEISMWVGGVILAGKLEPPQIVNEAIRIAKRGFDPVASFRKPPKSER